MWWCCSPVSPDTEQHLFCPPPAAVQSAPNPPQKPEKQLRFWEHHLQPLSWKPRTGAGRPARWETGGRSGTERAGRSAAGRCGSSRTHAAAHRGASLAHGRLVWRAQMEKRPSESMFHWHFEPSKELNFMMTGNSPFTNQTRDYLTIPRQQHSVGPDPAHIWPVWNPCGPDVGWIWANTACCLVGRWEGLYYLLLEKA